MDERDRIGSPRSAQTPESPKRDRHPTKKYRDSKERTREGEGERGEGRRGTTHPAKNAETVNVAYKAELEFELTVESTCPAAPRPLRALKEPGHMKQTSPRRHTWVTGL